MVSLEVEAVHDGGYGWTSLSEWFYATYGIPMPNDFSVDTAFLTLHPEKIYPMDKPWYHVTDDHALEAIVGQPGRLVPAAVLDHASQEVDRNLQLALKYTLLRQFGINTGASEYSVWMGTRIDEEQLILPDISQSYPDVERELVKLFGTVEFTDSQISTITYSPWVSQLFSALATNDYDYLTNHRHEINTWMNRFGQLTGLRDGWFTELRKIISGEQPSIHTELSDIIFMQIKDTISRHVFADSPAATRRATQGIVLEIDPRTQVRHTTFNNSIPILFPLDRNPQAIIAAPFIPWESVTRVFARKPSSLSAKLHHQLQRRNIPLLPAEAISPDIFLRGSERLPTLEDIDLEHPACSIRYDGDYQSDLRQSFRKGHILPAIQYHIPQDQLRVWKTIID